MILDIFLISVIICFIIDISGIIENIEWWLSKWLRVNCKIPKPFSCSLCMTFWVGLLWIIIIDFSLVNTVIVCLFAALTEQTTNTLLIIKHLINKVQDVIITKLDK